MPFQILIKGKLEGNSRDYWTRGAIADTLEEAEKKSAKLEKAGYITKILENNRPKSKEGKYFN